MGNGAVFDDLSGPIVHHLGSTLAVDIRHVWQRRAESDNGWSFSADAYPNRTGPGWAVSIGAVTGEGDDVIPTAASCTLNAAGSSGAAPFVPANGPVGYWAGFATR